MFIIDDILLADILMPYAKRLIGKGQDQFYDWLDDQGVKLVRRVWGHNPPVVEVLEDLGHYVKDNRGAADTLAPKAFTAELQTAQTLPAAQADEKVLRALSDFLTAIFDMVQALGHPAVLPGFLTGTNDLSVIDVRTPPGQNLEMPEISGQDNPEIVLWRPLGYGVLPQHWMPRLWVVVKATDVDRRKYENLADPDTTPQRFAEVLEDQPFVTGITRRHILVQHVQIVLPNIPPIPVVGGESSRIKWAESPDGAKAMLADMTSQLGERQDEDERWIRALRSLA